MLLGVSCKIDWRSGMGGGGLYTNDVAKWLVLMM